MAFCGALSYAELSAALPRSGGEYNFLSAIYHPAVGFMSGFVSIAVGFSAPIALSAMALGKYAAAAFPGIPATAISLLVVLLLAVAHSLERSGEWEFPGRHHDPQGWADFVLYLPGIFSERLLVLCSKGWRPRADLSRPFCRLADVCLVCLFGLERCRIHH